MALLLGQTSESRIPVPTSPPLPPCRSARDTSCQCNLPCIPSGLCFAESPAASTSRKPPWRDQQGRPHRLASGYPEVAIGGFFPVSVPA